MEGAELLFIDHDKIQYEPQDTSHLTPGKLYRVRHGAWDGADASYLCKCPAGSFEDVIHANIKEGEVILYLGSVPTSWATAGASHRVIYKDVIGWIECVLEPVKEEG